MDKAILAIDMPKDCYECPLAIETIHNSRTCCITKCTVMYDGKFPWCPLKPVPEKRDENGIWTMSGYIDDGYSNGWNDCLDEILG
jgi:hypothetical protein